MKARYTFTLDPEVVQALEHMAKTGRRSRSSMVESAVMQTFDRFIQTQKEKLEVRQEALAELKKGD